ncbi:DUF3040 domain-containing protein [Allonocardiopsis opalescens]|uniref:DUF3040 family protein n=1 Tax=Allonocardiopsis opalescens TaxID=1144618 RepID=A0A2T0QEA3_9ACTN|nr:DUF3040 domain-containing protein [Allonocardiopsis opalescens]PRY02210.1 Protein of unknown function (DUF3040) [Allonocardiopsis opalescens]
MSLSNREERLLSTIESALASDDPELAARMRELNDALEAESAPSGRAMLMIVCSVVVAVVLSVFATWPGEEQDLSGSGSPAESVQPGAPAGDKPAEDPPIGGDAPGCADGCPGW